MGNNKSECTICQNTQSDQNGNNKMIELNQCHHQFHKQCIDEWFKKKIQCPLCMQCYVNIQNTVQNEMILRHRKCLNHQRVSALSPTSEAIDVLLQSPISADCRNSNNSFFLFYAKLTFIFNL